MTKVAKDYQEIECKFLDVNLKELEIQLQAMGAKRHYRRKFRRYVFDYPDMRLHEAKAWVRVRDEGDRIRLGFKQRLGVIEGQADQGMHEVEVTVSDFEDTAKFLRSIGLQEKFYEENWRTLYTLDDVELCIDEWPLIPPYLEIESSSWEKVDTMARQLGFDPDKKLVCSTMQVYKEYGITEMDYKVLTFEKQLKRS